MRRRCFTRSRRRCSGKALLLAAGFLVLSAAGWLASEQITLTTSYPSPVGVYKKLIATGGSADAPETILLARDAGSVGIGTSAPRAKLDVAGGIRLGNEDEAPSCVEASAGTLRYTKSKELQICDGSGWAPVDRPASLECAYASRKQNEPMRVVAGPAGVVSAEGIGPSEDWGLRCSPAYKRMGCSIKTWGTGNLEWDIGTETEACLTDNEEFNARAEVSITCCKVL